MTGKGSRAAVPISPSVAIFPGCGLIDCGLWPGRVGCCRRSPIAFYIRSCQLGSVPRGAAGWSSWSCEELLLSASLARAESPDGRHRKLSIPSLSAGSSARKKNKRHRGYRKRIGRGLLDPIERLTGEGTQTSRGNREPGDGLEYGYKRRRSSPSSTYLFFSLSLSS